jgi:hypothetical protein
MKHPDLVLEQWRAAAALVDSTAQGLQDEVLHKTFINTAPVRAIIEKSDR